MIKIELISLVVLAMMACASTRRTTFTQSDSLTDSARLASAEARLDEQLRRRATTTLQRTACLTRRVERTEAIPAQQATLRVTPQNLRDLPDGAAFTAHDGRLTIEARRVGDTLRLEAHCDSMARRTIFCEETAEQHLARSDSLQDELSTLREAYRTLERSMLNQHTQIAEQRSRSPARRGWWLVLGLAAGTACGWWAHRTGIIKNLINRVL